MKIIIPVDEIDKKIYDKYIQQYPAKYTIYNLKGNNFIDFINPNLNQIITTTNLQIDFNKIYCKELNLINNNYSKQFWYNYIQQNKLLIMSEKKDLIICTHKNIPIIYILLDQNKTLYSLLSFKNILTNNGLKENSIKTMDICYQNWYDYSFYINQYWNENQKSVYNFLKQIPYQKLIKDLNIVNFYNIYYTNIKSIMLYFNYNYISNNIIIPFVFAKNDINIIQFYDKLANQINNIGYTPIYLLENKIIINEYGYITIPNNKKRLCIYLDEINQKEIQLIIPKEVQKYINRLNLNYVNDTTIITNNCIDIYIILMYFEKIINNALIQGEKIEPIERFIDI